jgi:hypothetical protein
MQLKAANMINHELEARGSGERLHPSKILLLDTYYLLLTTYY